MTAGVALPQEFTNTRPQTARTLDYSVGPDTAESGIKPGLANLNVGIIDSIF
jgi:hypothetical protein